MNALMHAILRFREAAPVTALAAALGLPLALPHEGSNLQVEGIEPAMIAAAIETVPYRLGNWVGREIPVPEAARRLLRPNAILSRQFVHLISGVRLDLTVVHCGDSRDMLGHYPPVCYPNNGWVQSSAFPGAAVTADVKHGSAIDLTLNGVEIPARVYEFSRVRSFAAGDESHIRIFNFFILPDGRVTADIEDIGLRTNWLGAQVAGVAQIQVVMDAHVPLPTAVDATTELLDALSPLFGSLGVKATASPASPEARSHMP